MIILRLNYASTCFNVPYLFYVYTKIVNIADHEVLKI